MFLNTLALGEWSVREWCRKGTLGMPKSTKENKTERQKSMHSKGKNYERRKFLEDWLDSLPKVPSHYARADTKKSYIEDNTIQNKH